MARVTTIIDDLDESPDATTITYAFDGQEYEIDLSAANMEKFRSAIEPYIKASRPVEAAPPAPVSIARAPRRRTGGGGSGRDDFAKIREWAQAQGKQVKPRGRIKKDIIEAYDAAHS